MLKIATPLAFDKLGKALHKGDVCILFGDSSISSDDITPNHTKRQVEILDILPNNRAVVICAGGDLKPVETGNLEKIETINDPQISFSDDQETLNEKNENEGFQRVRLLIGNNETIDGVADTIIALMKLINRAVLPIQMKVDKIANRKVAADGIVEEGSVDCEVQVKDNYSNRKKTVGFTLNIKNSEVGKPDTFSSGNVDYPFTEAGFRKCLDIPLKPYVSKKPTSATISNRDSN
jgi:hypothetical protein